MIYDSYRETCPIDVTWNYNAIIDRMKEGTTNLSMQSLDGNIQYHFIRDYVKMGVVSEEHIASEQIADLFTKSL